MKKDSLFQFKETLDLIIEFVYLGIIFIIPLYFAAFFPTYNIFELNKIVIFKILVWLLLFLTLTKLIFYFPKKLSNQERANNLFQWLKKYALIPLIFMIGLGLSLFFSTNQIQSFFGSYNRQAGYLSYLFYFLWFALLTFNVLTVDNRLLKSDPKDNLENKVDRIFIVATFSGFLVAIYGILQIIGIDFLTWPEDPLITRRTLSTFGQPNFLASWLLLVIPLSAYFVYKSKQFIFRFFFLLILVAQLACLFFTSSRGGLVALGLMILVFIIYLILFIRLKVFYKFIISLGLVWLAISGLWGLNYLFPGRFSGLFDLQNGSLAARVNFFQAASDAITKKPFWGYGLENGGEVFIRYYQSDWGIYGDVASSTDKAHNLFLDIIVATGFWGLALFTVLYYYFFRLANKNITEKKMPTQSLVLSLAGAAYLFSLLFSFSIVTGEIYFWLFLALLIVINTGQNKEEKDNLEIPIVADKNKTKYFFNFFVKIIIFFIIFSGIIFGIFYEFRIIIADHYFNRLYYALGNKQYFTAFTLADYVSQEKTNPINQEYYDRFLGEKLSDFYFEVEELSVKKVAQEKLIEVDKKLRPTGYENIYVKAKINSVLQNYQISEEYFRELIRRTPYWPKIYVETGRLFAREKRLTEAVANYQFALLSLPEVNDNRLNEFHRNVIKLYRRIILREMGDVYFSAQDYATAEEYYQASYVADVNDFTIFKKIADTYYRRGQLDQALEYNKRGLARNPADYNWWLAIISLEMAKEDKSAALKYLNEAKTIFPEEKIFSELEDKYNY